MHPHTVPAVIGTPGRIPPDGRPYLLSMPSGPAAPGLARDFVRPVLRRTPLRPLLETAVLLTSEAVTRSHLRTPGTADILLRVLTAPHGLLISVHDSAAGPVRVPAAPRADEDADLGLLLLSRLADAWGTTPFAGPPRSGSLWFELYAQGAGADAPAPSALHP
ncbi:ATP-binding protein [Streptomyces sp. NPDC101227]|uniref:ATP-binding protein n=1 Tax=Streptomyces sp. NPDC101227 TaxID=3366136 RepID=UPI0037FC1AE0